MTIVVLDGYAMNPGDLDWAPLKALGRVIVHDRTPAHKTVERSTGAQCLLTNKTVLGRHEIEQLAELNYIGVLATGYNVVDCAAARDNGVTVTNVPAYSTDSVAQMVFAHILHHASAVAEHSASVRDGGWVKALDFSYQVAPLCELRGKVLGIIGFGTIGRAVANLAKAFEMRVIAHTRSPAEITGVRFTDLESVFRDSDFLSLHCPLTPETEQLVNQKTLALMKSTAVLINTGRGPLLDEAAVAEALNARRIAGAGLDVLSNEPPAADNPLLEANNCTITPHIAWATREARKRLLDTTVANLTAYLQGEPQNVVTSMRL